jgi:hypothetical protein
MRYHFHWLVSVFLFAAAPLSAEQLPRKIKPVVIWSDINSKQAKESFDRYCSQEEWEANWHKQMGRGKGVDGTRCPQIDFDSYIVIAIFHGKWDSNSGISIICVSEDKEFVRVRYRPSWYQLAYRPGRAERDAKSLGTQSYAYVVLPRSPKAVVLEEDVCNLIASPPVWKQRAKLAAMKR